MFKEFSAGKEALKFLLQETQRKYLNISIQMVVKDQQVNTLKLFSISYAP